MIRNTRHQPDKAELRQMTDAELKKHAKKEAKLLTGQKQTAVPRLLNELARRMP